MPPLLYPFRRTIERLSLFADDPGTVAAPRPRGLPDGPAAIAGPRRRGRGRPHSDATVAALRRLIEQTTLTYREIAAKTGVPRRSFGRWARDGGWQRPLFAPRATDMVPTARAGRKLKLRLLAERLRTLAEHLYANDSIMFSKMIAELLNQQGKRVQIQFKARFRGPSPKLFSFDLSKGKDLIPPDDAYSDWQWVFKAEELPSKRWPAHLFEKFKSLRVRSRD